MENDRCVEISFFDPSTIFEGTIRHHPEKQKILKLASQLSNLRKLDLRKCKVGTLPSFSSDLEYLDLSCNDLVVVPNWVYGLNQLKYLSLGSNHITELKSVPPVETLKVHKNRIKEMPPLPDTIRFLNLYLNEMPELPPLPKLEFLSFGVTQMRTLPSLPNSLRWLSLVANQIEKLPADFCDLKKLEGVRLAKNALSILPGDIGTMNIKQITLYKNNLKCLPESFFNLQLIKLNVSNNPLTDKDRIQKTFGHIEFYEC